MPEFFWSVCNLVWLQVLVTDVWKPDQLLAMAQNSDIVLNCVGPYRYTGENVVAACASAGTDYLDVTGEPGPAWHIIPSREITAYAISPGICACANDVGPLCPPCNFPRLCGSGLPHDKSIPMQNSWRGLKCDSTRRPEATSAL